MCLVILIGLFSLSLWGWSASPVWAQSPAERAGLDGEWVTVSGIVDRREETPDVQILYLRQCSIYHQDQILKEPQLLIYNPTKKEIPVGAGIVAEGAVRRFDTARNPGNFSMRAYEKIRNCCVSMRSDAIRIAKEPFCRLPERLCRFRTGWSKWLLSAAGEKYGGALCAVLLGQKREMDAQMKECFQINGIAHILAVSGLHLSFVGLGLYRIARKLGGSFVTAGIAGLTFLVLYIGMIGTTVSAVRALVMFGIRVGADMSGRVYDAPTSFFVSMLCVVLWRPFAFFDLAFQLSFSAIGAIIFVRPVILATIGVPDENRERDEKNRFANGLSRVAEGIREALISSLSVQLVTLPVVLWHSFEVPVYSVILNVLVIPLMGILLAAGMIGSILGMLGLRAGVICVQGCEILFRFYEWLCECVERFPLHRVVTGRPAPLGIVLYGIALVAAAAMLARVRGRKEEKERNRYLKKEISYSFACLLFGITTLGLSCPAFVQPECEVTFLDVGQGDCAFVRERNGLTCLIDGGSSDVSDVGKYRIEPFLKARGVSNVDCVFVSHGDFDHIGGIAELIRRQETGVTIGAVIFPDESTWDEKLKELYDETVAGGVRAYGMQAGEVLKGTRLRICALSSGDGLGGNEASAVQELSYGSFRVLFTGDLEGAGEERLVQTLREREEQRPYDILKVSHHGSRGATSERLLALVRPKAAVISAGRDNRYGHPHAETLLRLKECGAVVLRTDECGAVTIRLRDGEAELDLYDPRSCVRRNTDGYAYYD